MANKRVFFMWNPEAYTIIASLFPRLLGLIYFFAFGAFVFQIRGLLGKNGILPIGEYLDWVRARLPKRHLYLVPTIFWINASDAVLMSVAVGGTILSVLLMLGVFPPLMLLLLYILYLSIVSAGQDFLSFGWEGFLLETTVNAFFLSMAAPPNLAIWISINLVLFRFHLQAGAVKLQSQDPNWRNLTAIAYHYQSQPIPNTVAWYVHKWPMWFHKLSTALMFIIELIVPFAIFGNEWMRLGAFFAFVGLQWVIWITGNFSYLNHLTVVLSTILVANVYLEPWISYSPPVSESSLLVSTICYAAGIILIFLQIIHLWHHFMPSNAMGMILQKISPYHIANRYGIFAVMTTVRYEVVFEGSDDGIEWKEYLFFHKPSEITRRPRRISPYQPRIDWQAWFLPLRNYRYDEWFGNFIFRLLKGTPEVLPLVRYNPFPDRPPKFIRTVLYEYIFSSKEEKNQHGWWWKREYRGLFTRSVSLEDHAE
jgi:lipase maturation factor 1